MVLQTEAEIANEDKFKFRLAEFKSPRRHSCKNFAAISLPTGQEFCILGQSDSTRTVQEERKD